VSEVQNESPKTFVFTSELQPILAKQSSARRAKYKMKVQKLSFLLLSRSLSWRSKVVQGEHNKKTKVKNFHFLVMFKK